MNNWFYNNKEDDASDDALKELEKALLNFESKGLSVEDKSLIRTSLVRRIRNDGVNLPATSYRLSNLIRLKGRKMNMPTWAKLVVRERVLDYVETTNNWEIGVNYGHRFSWKGYMATFLLVAFGVSIFSFLPIQTKIVMAKATVLDSVSGEVFVQRKNVTLRGVDDLELQKGDTVLTKGDGYATIKFFNNSVTRLNTNTDVDLVALDVEYLNPTVSNIELYLQEGRVWTTVIKLTDRSRFGVKTENLSAGIDVKAAFDMVVKEDRTEVSVFNNVVEVKSVNVNSPAKTVVSGYQASVIKDGDEDIKIEKMMKKDDLIVSSEWVAVNLSSDDQYKNELIEAKEEEVLVTEIDEDTDDKLLVSKTPVLSEKAEELKERFSSSQKRLVSGQAQLVRGNREDGIDHLKSYRNELKHIKEDIDIFLSDDPESIDALYGFMNGIIDEQLDDLSATLPGDRLYRAKEYLQEIEVNFARDEMERIEIQLDQAGDILLEMEDLINEDKANLVSTLLKRYNNRSEEFVVALGEGNLNVLEEKKISLIKQQVEQMKVLTAIQRTLVEYELYELRDRVGLLRGEMLRKFVQSLDVNPSDIPVEVVADVKGLYETYNADIADEDFADPVLEKLSDDDYQMSFIKPDITLPEEIGVVTPIEATPEVRATQSIEFGLLNLNSDLKWDIMSSR